MRMELMSHSSFCTDAGPAACGFNGRGLHDLLRGGVAIAASAHMLEATGPF